MHLQIPTANIYQKVFAISTAPKQGQYGSSFAISIDRNTYLITAAHVIRSMKHRIRDQLFILKDNKWNQIDVIPHFISMKPPGLSFDNNYIDIAVIKPSISIGLNLSDYNLSSANLYFGQDVYFLGFPFYNNPINYKSEDINNGFPIPFIKKATLSKENYPLFFLDGHNNIGFSGGPVVSWNFKEKSHIILGIISAYINHQSKIILEGSSNSQFYFENSGIAIAFNIDCVNNFINSQEWNSFYNEKF